MWVILFLLLILLLAFCNNRYQLFAINSIKKINKDEHCIRIMTFNVGAPDGVAFRNGISDSIVALLHENKPDIVCIQELSDENHLCIKSQLEEMYGAQDSMDAVDQYWRKLFYMRYPTKNYRRHNCIGDIDVSDMNETTIREIEQMRIEFPMRTVDVEYTPGKWIRIFSAHLRSSAYSTARRSMSKDSHWWEGIPMYYSNYKNGKAIRDYEAQNVRRLMDETINEGLPTILVGDLNDWSGSDCMDILQGYGSKKMRDAWWEVGNGFGFTFHGWHMHLRLDHILVSNHIEVLQAKVVDTNISDHKPLVVDFRVKNNQ